MFKGCQHFDRWLSLMVIASICSLDLCLGAQNGTELYKIFGELDPCFTQAVYSFQYPSAYPPTTTKGLEESCRSQHSGIKCLKDRSKNLPALVKRGVSSFVTTRQRYNRKYCTNFNSEATKQYVRDFKCIMDKKLSTYREIDANMTNIMLEIRKRNYDDSAKELKYICCTLLNYRKKIIDSIGPECEASKATIEEMIMSIVSNDINLICDDEERLTLKVCPTLEPYNLPRQEGPAAGATGPGATIMYLIMTLGEPDTMIK